MLTMPLTSCLEVHNITDKANTSQFTFSKAFEVYYGGIIAPACGMWEILIKVAIDLLVLVSGGEADGLLHTPTDQNGTMTISQVTG